MQPKQSYSPNTSLETYESDEEIYPSKTHFQSQAFFEDEQEDSDSVSSEDDQMDNCQDHGGAFFENFYFDLLAQEIKVQEWSPF